MPSHHSGADAETGVQRELTHLVAAGPAMAIARLLAPLAEDMGFVLVRVRFSGADGRTLQVMAERFDGTMAIEDCESLSRALSALLDVENAVAGSYVLEVSSPGINRPLSRRVDFERWSGFEAHLEGVEPEEGKQCHWRGILKGIREDAVLLETVGEGETVVLPFQRLAGAHLVATGEMIRKSLKKQDMMRTSGPGSSPEQGDKHGSKRQQA